MSFLVKCHSFWNPVITAGECSLGRFRTVPTGNTFMHRCTYKLHTDVVLHMYTQMLYRCADVFWSQLDLIQSNQVM